MNATRRDWLAFAAVVAALTAAHIGTAFASGSLPGADPIDGLLFYAGKALLGPLVGLAYAGLKSAALRSERPGMSAARAALVVGALAYLTSMETRALLLM